MTWAACPWGYRNLPGRLPRRFLCAEDDASSVEVPGVRLVGRTAEDVDHAADPELGESSCLNDPCVLLNEECSCNSTCPEVNIRDRVIRQRLLHHDIGDLQASSGHHHSIDFLEDPQLVRTQVDDAI